MRWLPLLGLLLIQDSDVDSLIKQLTEGSIEERDKAVKDLIDQGDKSAPKIRALIKTAEGDHRVLLGQILERIAIPKKLRGVLPPISRVNIDAKDKSLREVLEELQRQTLMPMKLGRADRSGQWPKVTVRVEDAAPLEALNAICRAAKYYWWFPSGDHFGGISFEDSNESKPSVAVHEGPELQFAPGDFDKPRQFVRHYEVELWELQLNRSSDFRKIKSRCELTVGLFWPAGVKPHSSQFEVTSVLDDRGNQLLEGPDDPTAAKGWGLALQRWNRCRFRFPDQGTKVLASVQGKARLFYLLESKTVTFESPEKAIGTMKEVEGRSARLVDFKWQAQSFTARLQFDRRVSRDRPALRVRQGAGKFVGPIEGVPVKDTSEPLFDFAIYGQVGRPDAIEVVVDTICAEDAFDFEFKDVPLP